MEAAALELYSTYKTMITDKSFNHVLSETVEKYREAVSFLLIITITCDTTLLWPKKTQEISLLSL